MAGEGALSGGGGDPDGRSVLRVLCHEFRTPVASVQALARALAQGTTRLTQDQRLEAVQMIADHAEHLAAMLDAVRTVTEHLPADPARRPAVARLTDLASAAADAAGVTGLDLLIEPHVEAVNIDVTAVRRILTNLLENARRHGRAPIVLSGRRCAGELRLVVADSGPGMPSDMAVRAFDQHTAQPEGTRGLGLWIVAQLVAMLGGSVRTEANQPCGTRVEVVLPLPA